MTQLTVNQVLDLIDELTVCNGYWAGELSMMGCATLFDLELDPSEIEDLTAVLFDDDYGDEELALVAQALDDRPADPDVIGFNELVQVAERYDCEVGVLSAELAELTA
jgi:hypothetical protein